MQRLIALAVITALAGCAARKTDRAYDGIIELEPRALGFEMGGRIARIAVTRGESVKAGQVLAHLDDTLERAQRPVREAEVAAAEARLELLMAGARSSDVRALEAQVAAATTQVEAAQRDLDRQRGLFSRGASTKALIDDLESRLQRARAERDAAAERLRTLQAGSRRQEVRAAAAQRDGARAALQALDERLRRYDLTAPADGLILDVVLKEGEVVSPGVAVVSFAQPERPYVDLFVPVRSLPGLQVGQEAAVTPDGDSQAYKGRVEHIAQTTEYTPRYILTEAERATLVVRVRVRLADPQRKLHAGVPCRVSLGHRT
jgi:HlyD family secretion protein